MKRLISLFLLTLGIILPILAQQKEIDVYLVGGQSNAQDKLMLKISQPLLKLTQESESIILVSSTKERAVSNGTLYAKLLKQKINSE